MTFIERLLFTIWLIGAIILIGTIAVLSALDKPEQTIVIALLISLGYVFIPGTITIVKTIWDDEEHNDNKIDYVDYL